MFQNKTRTYSEKSGLSAEPTKPPPTAERHKEVVAARLRCADIASQVLF